MGRSGERAAGLQPGTAGLQRRHGGGGPFLTGGAGDDCLNGLDGDDRLQGHGGHDILRGGAGHDRLDAGAGNDQIDDAFGDDRLWGRARRHLPRQPGQRPELGRRRGGPVRAGRHHRL
ncbi:hypothetical protein [Rhodovulum visakhapatnamense]|uniref:hypothetical protein n=1 Tax=Rhodovulum visakhapatnamense TaxID=364297 RepID=UPI001FBAD938